VSSAQAARPNPLPVLVVLGAGTLGLLAGIAAGGNAVVAGALAFFFAALLALGQTAWPVITWPNALLVFIASLWFVPIKLYRFPVSLPFQLELYRVLIVVLVGGFVVWSLTTKRQVESLGAGKSLFVLTATILASQVLNASDIDIPGSEGQAVKSASLVLSLIIVFLLFASVLSSFREIELMVAALVLGGAVVAVAAIYEGRTLYNVFDHLAQWVPIFERNEREVTDFRGGRLRVHSSAQHPIALGAALMMLMPLGWYLLTRAKTQLAKGLWAGCMLVIAAGAAATISRTTVAMAVSMAIVVYLVRRQVLVKLLPFLLVLPIFVHASAPGALGGLWKSFGPQGGEGFVQSFYGREGESGSGRLSDVGPAIDLWKRSPIVGLGLDNPSIATSGEDVTSTAPTQAALVPIIFDDQYLLTLVTLGLAGLVALSWFIWGTVIRLVRRAREQLDHRGDLIGACGVACAGYGAGMLFYDSLAFIQVTLLLFITAALGLKTMALSDQTPTESATPQS
jgi:hypothetical protein